jgi:phosphoribosylformylglycinamidine synthase
LPGALTRNSDLHFICADQRVSVENTNTPWTRGYAKGEEIVIPIKNGEGSFQCSDETLKELEDEGRIVLRYVGKNPNGSRNAIAGISNKRGNVVGVMPHPEQAIENLTGPSEDGLAFFTSILKEMVSR